MNYATFSPGVLDETAAQKRFQNSLLSFYTNAVLILLLIARFLISYSESRPRITYFCGMTVDVWQTGAFILSVKNKDLEIRVPGERTKGQKEVPTQGPHLTKFLGNCFMNLEIGLRWVWAYFGTSHKSDLGEFQCNIPSFEVVFRDLIKFRPNFFLLVSLFVSTKLLFRKELLFLFAKKVANLVAKKARNAFLSCGNNTWRPRIEHKVG